MNNLNLVLPIAFVTFFSTIFVLQRKKFKKQDKVDVTELRKAWTQSIKNYVFY